VQTAGRRLFFPHSRFNGVPARENSARDHRQSFDNAIKEGVPVTRDEKTILFGRAAARPRAWCFSELKRGACYNDS